MLNKRRSAEQATLRARLDFLAAEEAANKPHVMDGHDHTACAGKIRQTGYMHKSHLGETWIEDRSTVDCKYDRRRVDPACAKAKCSRIDL